MPRSADKSTHQYAELAVDRITCYANNPRVARNPEYTRLKHSLEKNGIEAPLVVTQKPGDENYMLQAGGNTRLSIVQSLHESGDEDFATVPCIVKEWTSEINVLVAHLRENDVRGNLMFIERALGVMAFAKLVANDQGEMPSQRELARQLFELGYALSQPVISAMDYAVNRLYGLLPTALEHGMGKRQVTAIRALEHSAVKVWDRQCPDEAGEFAELFGELVKGCDGVSFDLETLTSNVAHEIAISAELDINAVRMLLEAERSGESLQLNQYEPVAVDDTRKHDEPVERRPFNLNRELQRRRNIAVEAAVALAESYELVDCVQVTLDARFGYFMCELPKSQASKTQLAVWKLLATACDQTRASKKVLRQILHEDSRFFHAIEQHRPTDVYAELATIDLIECGERLFLVLDDGDWNQLVNLLAAYRILRKLANEHSINLWKA